MRALITAIVLLLSACAYADEPNSRPFADSLKWGALAAGAAAFDIGTSLAWSSQSRQIVTVETCFEGNAFQANPDGTVKGARAALIQGSVVAGLTGILYATKKLHWRRAELVTKAAIGVQASQWTYYGIKSLAVCR